MAIDAARKMSSEEMLKSEEIPETERVSSHIEEMFEHFDLHRDERLFCDILLQVEDVEFPAHRLLLSSASNYFKLLFTTEMKEKNQKSIRLQQVSPFAVQVCLNFIYNKQTEIAIDKLNEILFCVCLFELKRLKATCFKKMEDQLSVENCLGFIQLSRRYLCKDFEMKGQDFLTENIKLILLDSPEFIHIDKKFVSMCLQLESTALADEITLFEALVRWTKFDEEERMPFFCDFLQFVRLPMMPKRYLCESVIEHCFVKSCITQCYQYAVHSACFQLTASKKNLHPWQMQKRGISARLLVVSNKIQMFEVGKVTGKDQKQLLEAYSVNNEYSNTKQIVYSATHQSLHYLCHNQNMSFNINDKNWRSNAAIPYNATGQSVACVSDYIYVVGGDRNNGVLNVARKFDITNKQWHQLPSLNTARANASITILDNKLYLMGGKRIVEELFHGFQRHLRVDHIKSVECFDLSKENEGWTFVKEMNRTITDNKVQTCNKKVYVVGLDCMEVYDPSKDLWTSLNIKFSQQRTGFGLFRVFDRVMVLGGNKQENSIEEWDEETEAWKLSNEVASKHIFTQPCSAFVLQEFPK